MPNETSSILVLSPSPQRIPTGMKHVSTNRYTSTYRNDAVAVSVHNPLFDRRQGALLRQNSELLQHFSTQVHGQLGVQVPLMGLVRTGSFTFDINSGNIQMKVCMPIRISAELFKFHLSNIILYCMLTKFTQPNF